MPLFPILVGALLAAAPLTISSAPAVAGAKDKAWTQDYRTYDDDDDDDRWELRTYKKERYRALKRERRAKAYTYRYRSPWGPFYGPPGL